MGMYDEISFNCIDCGAEIIAQSKSGECTLGLYPYHSVPVSVAFDANRHAPYECECGSKWEFGNIPNEEMKVILNIKKVGSEE